MHQDFTALHLALLRKPGRDARTRRSNTLQATDRFKRRLGNPVNAIRKKVIHRCGGGLGAGFSNLDFVVRIGPDWSGRYLGNGHEKARRDKNR